MPPLGLTHRVKHQRCGAGGAAVDRVQAPRVRQSWPDALGGAGFALPRHAETAPVDRALQRIAVGVWVDLGERAPEVPA